MSSTLPLFAKLNSNDYNTWSGDMEGYCAQALWCLISGTSTPPKVSTQAKEGEEEKLEAWQIKADKAACIMWLMVENTQRVHAFQRYQGRPGEDWKQSTCRSDLELASTHLTICSLFANAVMRTFSCLSTVLTMLYTAFVIFIWPISLWTS
jgi:hypothetical protein